MDLSGVTWIGPPVDDHEVLGRLPDGLRTILQQVNGFILYGGALHLRGACQTPAWHSLDTAWNSEAAFHRLYPAVEAHWVPLGEDCVGDQLFLAGGSILYLDAEIGEVHSTAMSLRQFLDAVEADPVNALQAEPLLRFRQEKGDLPEGHLILAYPPFCTEEARAGVSLAAAVVSQVHLFHADLARGLPPDGGKLKVEIID
jgi:hypothetical protein